uniref:Soluble scavenger receptor cysteine-rich domain-containing protein SSC5D n=1 Tax=Athene cunicularia TaxID=194338 RepID=A0A663MV70_ATHCN
PRFVNTDRHTGQEKPSFSFPAFTMGCLLSPEDVNTAKVEIRLVGGPSRCSGRVEVLHEDVWGTVCDDHWDLREAKVVFVCKQLGCGDAVLAPIGAKFGQGRDTIWLDDVNCTGVEAALSECPARPWGDHNCYHKEDASAICSGNPGFLQSTLLLRVLLVAWGPYATEEGFSLGGSVFFAHWGALWPFFFSSGLMLSLPLCFWHVVRGESYGGEAAVCRAGGDVWGRGGTHTNAHGPEHPPLDVSAESGITVSTSVRLVGGPSRCSGRVEVLHKDVWGTVCDDHWDLREAKVVCRQLGCGTALSAPRESKYGEGKGQIWLSDVNCTGTEASLTECETKAWGDNICNHVEDASVECSEVDVLEGGPVRLVDGPNKCAGRVEVLHENRWGSICDDHWDMKDAEVVCKQVGCGSPLSAPGSARYRRGSDIIWLDDVECNGTEESIFDCQARPWGEHNCYHGEDASVTCTGNASPWETDTGGSCKEYRASV